MSHNWSQHNPHGQIESMEYSSTSHTHPSDNSRPRSPSNANLIEVFSSSLNQSGSLYDDYGYYTESSYMVDSSFGDETQYNPSEHSCNKHVSRYEYHRTSDVHGSTADSRSGHDKYENHYQHSYVQRISGDRHCEKSCSSEGEDLSYGEDRDHHRHREKVVAVNVMKM